MAMSTNNHQHTGRRAGGLSTIVRSLMIVAGLCVGLLGATDVAHAEDPSPAYIAPNAGWLETVNYYRAMANLAPVVENPSLSVGAQQHSCYMLLNGMSHDEIPGRPGYTAEGDSAGNNGNVAVSSGTNVNPRSHIELWMTGPFHAIGVLRSQLTSVGFGMCENLQTTPWRSAATLDVLRGLANAPRSTVPVLFPGDGMTTNLDHFIVETPDPLAFCGWSGSAGLPVIALMPEAVTGNVSTAITGPNGPVETCSLSKLNTNGVAQAILGGDNAVVAIPRAHLAPGRYNVMVTTQARTVTWSFTVDPAAATGVMPTPANAQPVGAQVGFQPLVPTRLADTRIGLGATRLQANVPKRIQISGRGEVPAGASAVAVNIAVVAPEGAGYLTVWNCAAQRPTVSSVNFAAGETLANAANISLDAGGGLCVFSPSAADVVIDVTGAFSSGGSNRFSPVSPARVMDTRSGFGAAGRIGDDQTVELQIAGTAGVPFGATAVTMNVASVNAEQAGYVTVYPCGTDRPLVSSGNPQPGQIRPNMVTVPLSADGRACFYTLNAVDLVVDVTGYYSTGGGAGYTPSAPFRFVDTRDGYRAQVNAGTGGRPMAAGETIVVQIAGERGVPLSATAISLNIATTQSAGEGYVTAWPCDQRPNASTANMRAGDAVSNGAGLALSPTGALCLYAQTATHVVLDVNGWWG